MHACLFAPPPRRVSLGDTLFCLGCGRLFEGTPQQMWASLSKLLQLPDETGVYCAHEYTQVGGWAPSWLATTRWMSALLAACLAEVVWLHLQPGTGAPT